MWYRFAQLGSTLAQISSPVLTIGSPLLGILSDPTLLYLGNLKKKFFELDYKIQENIKSLSPNQQQKFQNKLNNLRSDLSNLNNNISAQDRVETWNNLLDEVQNQKNNQDTLVIKDLRNLVDQRTSGSFEGKNFYDADKILKVYLDAKMADDFFSTAELGEDILEISRFFIMNATGPKFDIVKNILRNIRVASWGSDVVSIIIAFYLNTKLSELINVLRNKKPFTFKEETAIALIESKIAINGMKIGISLNNIVNKNPLGQITGHIGSAGIYGLEQLQGMMGTDKSIKKLVSGN